jgi:hypothetical protein
MKFGLNEDALSKLVFESDLEHSFPKEDEEEIL